MDRNILLTYEVEGYNSYEWFEDVEECKEFIEENKDFIAILECQEIKVAANIKLNL
ncbi:MAG: hypothetical protein LIR50_05825 [Bacillota bacterium]|nr:hypothetical protein [Bacillota bacterium]